MDFRKIEWIFFIAFLGINIFLFSIYWNSRHEFSLVVNSNQRDDIVQRLENDGITYEKKLSNKHYEGYYLSAEQVDLNDTLTHSNQPKIHEAAVVQDKVLTSYPTNDQTFNLQRAETSFNRLMEKNDFILQGEQYHYLPSISKTDKKASKIIGAQRYEEIPFIDETSRVTLDVEETDGKMIVTKYTQSLLKDIEPLREKMSLYSEKEILNTLYINNHIPEKSKILDIYLGYFRTLEVREKNVYVPVWFVKVEGADKVMQIEKVNAISNQVITNNLVPKVENQ
ncbi:two-component system regulatory protein YycI [Enterococcus sp. CSURQ0835]|uniref:two-component system regulatory protein YycI n=1 Tax=Enterococcus sp. CSURQ0835 TaxID=2681394 RepID=UPI0013588997|nr:two-component system regulatory protein YycI [Enterococcus sp. CSURQ0835]